MTRRIHDGFDVARAPDDAEEHKAEAAEEGVDVAGAGSGGGGRQEARGPKEEDGVQAGVVSGREVVRATEPSTRDGVTDVVPAWAMVLRDGPIPDVPPPRLTTRVVDEPASGAAEADAANDVETRTSCRLRTGR